MLTVRCRLNTVFIAVCKRKQKQNTEQKCPFLFIVYDGCRCETLRITYKYTITTEKNIERNYYSMFLLYLLLLLLLLPVLRFDKIFIVQFCVKFNWILNNNYCVIVYYYEEKNAYRHSKRFGLDWFTISISFWRET